MNRILCIEFFRFFFMLQICLWHFNKCWGFMEHGYIAVEFFFVLSGFLLYRSAIKEESKTVIDYTVSKIKRFFPKILLSSILYLLFTISYSFFVSKDFVPSILATLNDIFFISGIGIVKGGMNPALWYVSVLIFGGGILYALLKNIRSITISVLCPLTLLLTYGYILAHNDNNLELWSTEACFYIPFWRGVAGMSLGCILSHVHLLYEKQVDCTKCKLLDILFIVALFTYIEIVFLMGNYDNYALICISIIVWTCFIRGSIINKVIIQEFWKNLGKLSFDMLVLHALIFRILHKIFNMVSVNIHVSVAMLIYVGCLLIACYCFSFIYDKCFKRFFW